MLFLALLSFIYFSLDLWTLHCLIEAFNQERILTVQVLPSSPLGSIASMKLLTSTLLLFLPFFREEETMFVHLKCHALKQSI